MDLFIYSSLIIPTIIDGMCVWHNIRLCSIHLIQGLGRAIWAENASPSSSSSIPYFFLHSSLNASFSFYHAEISSPNMHGIFIDCKHGFIAYLKYSCSPSRFLKVASQPPQLLAKLIGVHFCSPLVISMSHPSCMSSVRTPRFLHIWPPRATGTSYVGFIKLMSQKT